MSPLGLLGVDAPVVWSVVAILAGIVLGRSLRWYGKRLDERRPSEERELMQLRSRETMIVLVATAIPYATTIIVLIVLASFFLPRSGARRLGLRRRRRRLCRSTISDGRHGRHSDRVRALVRRRRLRHD